MSNYTCPLCGTETPRDLAVFLDHTNGHILDAIRKKHPEWTDAEGVCKKCEEYFKQQMGTNE